MHFSSLITGITLSGCTALLATVLPVSAAASGYQPHAYSYNSYQQYPSSASYFYHTYTAPTYMEYKYVYQPPTYTYYRQPAYTYGTQQTGYAPPAYGGHKTVYPHNPMHRTIYKPVGVLHGDICGDPLYIPWLPGGDAPLQLCMQGYNSPYVW